MGILFTRKAQPATQTQREMQEVAYRRLRREAAHTAWNEAQDRERWATQEFEATLPAWQGGDEQVWRAALDAVVAAAHATNAALDTLIGELEINRDLFN